MRLDLNLRRSLRVPFLRSYSLRREFFCNILRWRDLHRRLFHEFASFMTSHRFKFFLRLRIPFRREYLLFCARCHISRRRRWRSPPPFCGLMKVFWYHFRCLPQNQKLSGAYLHHRVFHDTVRVGELVLLLAGRGGLVGVPVFFVLGWDEVCGGLPRGGFQHFGFEIFRRLLRLRLVRCCVSGVQERGMRVITVNDSGAWVRWWTRCTGLVLWSENRLEIWVISIAICVHCKVLI